MRKNGNELHLQDQGLPGTARVHDRADDDEPVHPQRRDPAALVLPLRALARRLGRNLRAHGEAEDCADRPRVPRRRVSAELRSAISLSLAERMDFFDREYEDYVIQFRLDEVALAGMIDWFDLDVDASRVALRDGEPVSFGNLGLRGDEAWIGGVDVVPRARDGRGSASC